ncbi:MAG: OmpA family protein [Robiginitomaculum sp.]
METFGRWLWGIIILGIVAAVFHFFTPWGAKAHSAQLGLTIENSLHEGGYKWAGVDMAGNVAKVTGVAPSQSAKNGAISMVASTKCEKCSNAKKTWHEVDGSAITIEKVIPAVSPYTLSGVRTEHGGIVLNGYVHDEDEKAKILADANRLFSSVSDKKIKIARGAPNASWYRVARTNLESLAKLESGDFAIEDLNSVLRGKASSADIRSGINKMISALPTGYNGAANIAVPNVAAENTGEIRSERICQELFESLKGNNKINFAYNRAAIRGAQSLALLGSLASAANQCSSFRISVEGHTDADGKEAYNRELSQRRADAVVEYLIGNGVNVENISAIGYGETNPIASNDTPQGMAKNRRIEFKVTRSK